MANWWDEAPRERLDVEISGELAQALREYVAKSTYGTLEMFVEQSLWGRIQSEEGAGVDRAALRALVQDALDDPSPPRSHEQVWTDLEAYMDRYVSDRAA